MSVPSDIVIKAGLPKPVEPLEWLIGKWRCENTGNGQFPTIQSFNYGEELVFSNVGQPVLNVSSFTWHPEFQHQFAIHQSWNIMLRIQFQIFRCLVHAFERMAIHRLVLYSQYIEGHINKSTRGRKNDTMNFNCHFEMS